MARIDYGIMGPFNGKVGTVVGYLWNGKPCMRAYKRYVNNPRTEAQQEHRTLFKQEVQLAAKMRWAVTTTMTEAAREAGMTSYNLFVHMNQEAFGMEHTPQSLRDSSPKTGEQPIGSNLVVDYSRLMLSMGDVPQVQLQAMEWSADNVLTIKYARGLGNAYDRVFLYVYVPELERGFLSAGTYRREKRITLALPDEFASHDAHVYLMVQAADGRWSHSLYAGEIAMDEVVGEEGVTADLTQKNNMSTQNETVEAKKETAETTTQHDKSKKVVSLHRRKRNDILINK